MSAKPRYSNQLIIKEFELRVVEFVVTGKGATVESLQRRSMANEKSRLKSGSVIKNTAANLALSKEEASKRSSVALKSNPAFKIKGKGTSSLMSKSAQRKNSIPKLSRQAEPTLTKDRLAQLLHENKLQGEQFLNEWRTCNDDNQTRKVRVTAWAGERMTPEDIALEVTQSKENFNSLQRELKRHKNKNPYVSQINTEYPIYGGFVPKLKLTWDSSGLDKIHLKNPYHVKPLSNYRDIVLTTFQAT